MARKRRWTKYGNTKITVDGEKFDSKGEYNRYCVLRILEMAGEISSLERQVRFDLARNPLSNRMLYMVLDFQYEENGVTVIEDFKGMVAPEWAIKWAWLHTLPQYDHLEKRISKAGD